MPLRTISWQTMYAAGIICLTSLLVQMGFCLNVTTEINAKFPDSENDTTFCVDPGGILHGHRDPRPDGRIYAVNGTELQFICDSDYVLILGDGIMACILGAWYPSNKPRCIPYRFDTSNTTYCPAPPYSPYSVLSTFNTQGEHAVGSTVRYNCLQGYKLVGPVSMSWLICGENGEWQPYFVPKCKSAYDMFKDIPDSNASDTHSNHDAPLLKSESASIMKVISYLAIPILVGFAIAILLNLKNHACLQLKNRTTPRSQDTLDSVRPNGPLNHNNSRPMSTLSPAELRQLSSQHYLPHLGHPTSYYGRNPDVYCLSNQGLPTYEEAIKDSSPPSFDVACRLEAENSNFQPDEGIPSVNVNTASKTSESTQSASA